MLESSGKLGDVMAETRYRFAAGYVEPGDRVVDAACGTGYGKLLLPECWYWGVDHNANPKVNEVVDLSVWEPGFDFDVWVGLETIEHLRELDHYVAQAKKARKWIIISTPIVPTMQYNPWHVRDHDEFQVTAMFLDVDWYLFTMLRHVDHAGFEYGLFAFRRR